MRAEISGIKTSGQYDPLALIYDRLMEHVNYKMWARYIKALLSLKSIKPDRIVDLSCGTGSFISRFKKAKTNIFGFDLSLPMLKQAREKGINVPFCCADFRSVPLKNSSFDVVLVLYDSINYIIDDEDIDLFICEVERILKNGGTLIFDAVSPYICRKEFNNYEESDFWDDFGYDRRSWYNQNEKIQYNEFKIYTDDQVFYEIHKQKIRSIAEWREIINRSPFELVDVFSNFSMHQVHDKSERAHFICRKTS